MFNFCQLSYFEVKFNSAIEKDTYDRLTFNFNINILISWDMKHTCIYINFNMYRKICRSITLRVSTWTKHNELSLFYYYDNKTFLGHFLVASHGGLGMMQAAYHISVFPTSKSAYQYSVTKNRSRALPLRTVLFLGK